MNIEKFEIMFNQFKMDLILVSNMEKFEIMQSIQNALDNLIRLK